MLNDNALTTLASAKEYLKITDASKDSLIESLINAASELIEGYCRRKLKEQTYVDVEYDGSGGKSLILGEYPVSVMSSIKVDGVVVDSSEYKIRKNTGIVVRLHSDWPEGILNLQVSYTAGYNPVPADLELACKHLVLFYYKTDLADFSRTFGEGFVLRPEAMPPQVKVLLTPYRKAVI